MFDYNFYSISFLLLDVYTFIYDPKAAFIDHSGQLKALIHDLRKEYSSAVESYFYQLSRCIIRLLL